MIIDWTLRFRAGLAAGAGALSTLLVGYVSLGPARKMDAFSLLFGQPEPAWWILAAVAIVLAGGVGGLLIRAHPGFGALLGMGGAMLGLSLQSGRPIGLFFDHAAGDVMARLTGETLLLGAFVGLVHHVVWLIGRKGLGEKHEQAPKDKLQDVLIFCAILTLAGLVVLKLVQITNERGQVIFAAAAAFYLGVLLAHQLVQINSFWPVWVVPVVLAAAGYLVSGNTVSPGAVRVDGVLFARGLPIDYLGPALLGGLAGLITSRRWQAERTHTVNAS